MKRIQRERKKGWTMPKGAMYVGRPTLYGNPFVVGQFVRPAGPQTHPLNDEVLVTHANCLVLFEWWARQMLVKDPNWLDPLKKATALACWCPLWRDCHVDIIIKLLKERVHA